MSGFQKVMCSKSECKFCFYSIGIKYCSCAGAAGYIYHNNMTEEVCDQCMQTTKNYIVLLKYNA